ncbi:hypothetical protein [Halioxenophilus aromaticivorans]|uniref:Uncharacterized protein n=1 Tax=Halioxenophilus aromaticivorans TaxID=1306992 RepID=A0AAV3U4Q8_9ALTE
MDPTSLSGASAEHKDVNLKIDSSTFTLDIEDRTWIGPGDHLKVSFAKAAASPPTLTIVDGQNPKKTLTFSPNAQVPFKKVDLSTYTEYLTFSVEHAIGGGDKYVWQVEIVRDRIPDAIKGKPGHYQSQVNFFFNKLLPRHVQPGPDRGSGGGFQPN